jgi:hypothetical protein
MIFWKWRARVWPPCFLRQLAIVCTLGIIGCSLSGCGKPFNVKSKVDLPPARYAATAASNGVRIQAQVITDEDFLYDRFDSNLISAGVLPVRVMLSNSGEQTVSLSKARFEIRGQSGGAFRAVEPRAAYKRLISYYEISAYNKAGYKESLDTFSEYAVDLKSPLEARQSREGFLFFLVPREVWNANGLTLTVSRIGLDNPTQVELKLN